MPGSQVAGIVMMVVASLVVLSLPIGMLVVDFGWKVAAKFTAAMLGVVAWIGIGAYLASGGQL